MSGPDSRPDAPAGLADARESASVPAQATSRPGPSEDPAVPLPGSDPAAWMLDPRIDFLNHGSFGARPRAVVAAQQSLRVDFEARPIEWLDRRRRDMVAEAQARVGAFLGMPPDRFGFVANASAAVCSVLRSLEFEPGDEIVTTDHAYGAVMRTIEHVARRTGAVPVIATVPVPVGGPGDVLEAVARCLGPRARLLVVDHVTSPTAIVLPAAELARLAHERGVRCLVDGAHAPGMLPLDVASIGADWYAGNLHKWCCAPVGAAFLHAAPAAPRVHPPVISHFHEESLVEEFGWQGTRDITPWLTAATAIEWMASAGGPGGWTAVRAANDALADEAAGILAAAWGTGPTAPRAMRGSMAAVEIPEPLAARGLEAEAMRDRLAAEHGIEGPILDFAGRRWARVSAQLYNRREQYERLAAVVTAGV